MTVEAEVRQDLDLSEASDFLLQLFNVLYLKEPEVIVRSRVASPNLRESHYVAEGRCNNLHLSFHRHFPSCLCFRSGDASARWIQYD